MSLKSIQLFLTVVFSLVFVFDTSLTSAQSINDLKKGVVKITAQVEGKTRVGAGFIVRLEKDATYIVTAAHVVEGDARPQVMFFPQQTKSFPARVLGLEGGSSKGLASLLVKGAAPEGTRTLQWDTEFEVKGGEPITVIGFPRTPPVAWAVTPGALTGQSGQYLVFSGSAVEGNSGGPLLVGEKVVGVVTDVTGQYGFAVPVPIVQVALRGWGVSIVVQQAATPQGRSAPEGGAPKPRGEFPHEITGKDGAPMVLIPAGEFLYGGRNQPVSLAAFTMDKFEVTTAIYAAFMEATGRAAPRWWNEVSQLSDGDRPVIGVTWHDADTYCRYYGKRLPTSEEWEKAARGTDGRTYPWGNEEPNPSLAHYGKLTWKGYSTLATVKSYEGGKSPYGIYNMAGNVWEWTSSDHEHKKGGKVLRGGSWSHQGTDLRSADRERGLPTGSGYRIGFRCAQDAK